jgi:hypothetical protein
MQNLYPLIAISALFIAPIAYAQGVNETRWRASIESDIRNGAPARDICTNALSSATTSEDPSFKDWAYGVSKTYCPPDKMGTPQNPQPQQKTAINCVFPTDNDIRKMAKGIRVNLSRGECIFIANPGRKDGW